MKFDADDCLIWLSAIVNKKRVKFFHSYRYIPYVSISLTMRDGNAFYRIRTIMLPASKAMTNLLLILKDQEIAGDINYRDILTTLKAVSES